MNKIEVLNRELRALGAYWRNDWSDFDGRTLRNQIDHLLHWLQSDDEKEFTQFSEALKRQVGEEV